MPTLAACKQLVAKINKSSVLRQALKDRQKATRDAKANDHDDPGELLADDVGGDPNDDEEPESAHPLKMISHVVTRWSSAYMMMERIWRLRVPLYGMLKNELAEMNLAIDFRVVKAFVDLLEPYFSATQELQGEKYPTMPRVWEALTLLLWHTEEMEERVSAAHLAEVNTVRRALLREMEGDSNYIPVTDFLRICTVVDPTKKVCANGGALTDVM
jgi:hypothetical protein